MRTTYSAKRRQAAFLALPAAVDGDALAAAVVRGDLAAVRELLDAGADVDARTSDGSTALVKAVLWNHVDIVRWLLARGANPALEDVDGWTPLAIAHARHCTEIAALLDSAKEPL